MDVGNLPGRFERIKGESCVWTVKVGSDGGLRSEGTKCARDPLPDWGTLRLRSVIKEPTFVSCGSGSVLWW